MGNIKRLDNTTFEQWKSDIASIEIGDSKQNKFYPQIKSKHWGNECNLSIRLVDDFKGKVQHSQDEVKYINKGKEVRFYEVNTGDEHGGFEFDIRFNEKPESNVIEFTVQHKGLVCYKQEALTELEVQKLNAKRPDHVLGSLVFYHESKKHNEYKTGKAFQIPRPWVIDSNGWQVWCDQNIDGNRYSITMPAEFHSNAAYPILVDPTFGYTSVGASTGTYTDHVDCCEFTPAVAGTITDFNVYTAKLFGGTANMRMALYTKSGGQPSALQANTTANTSVNGTPGWKTGSSLTGTLTFTATAYYIATLNDDPGTLELYFDSGSANQFQISSSTPSPWSWTNPIVGIDSTFAAMASMYVNYTAAGGANTTDFFNMF